jgi:hypothetical protein
MADTANGFQILAALVVELCGTQRMDREDFVREASQLSHDLAPSDRAWAAYVAITHLERDAT